MKNKIKLGVIALLAVFLLLGFILLKSSNPEAIVKYEVGNCTLNFKFPKINSYQYNNLTKILIAYVWVNCCSDKIVVKKDGNCYKIFEKDYDGLICKCMCLREVTIFSVNEPFKLLFINKDGEIIYLTEYSIPREEFCGFSTYGFCLSDLDCVIGGCSGQVCQSKYEEPVITSCDWKECYNAKLYGLSCKCVNNKCQWAS